jgi:hypothetical protein
MNIGFDLDNIFISTPPFIPKALIARLYMKKSNGALIYRIPSKQEQLIRLISHYPLFRPPIKNNLAFLKSIRKDGHNFYLISSRYGFLQKMTNRIIKKHRLDLLFNKLYFNYENKQPHVFKSKLVNKLKLEKYVDDDLHLLKYITERNNRVKLYWLNNKINKQLSANLNAITNLANILQ